LKLDDQPLFDMVTDSLIGSGVIGWFNGKAEFGPRALGARSILADPRRHDAKDLLNEKVKRRESFRPFAPSILKEFVSEYFEVTDEVPFMEKVFPIKKEKQEVLPAVTHVDGTGRLQTRNQSALLQSDKNILSENRRPGFTQYLLQRKRTYRQFTAGSTGLFFADEYGYPGHGEYCGGQTQ
jgi:hypothetical protein